MTRLSLLQKDLESLRDVKRAQISARFFKTDKGQYGWGDVFWGISVPVLREVAKKYTDLNLSHLQKLLLSKIHEHRFVALVILVNKFKKVSSFPLSFPRKRESNDWIPHQVRDDKRKQIFDFYLKNAKNVNNWDLVDLSAEHIVGDYLLQSSHSGANEVSDKMLVSRSARNRILTKADSIGRYRSLQNDILYKLARSKNLWERRIAIVSTFEFIKGGRFEQTFKIAEILLCDEHDLIQKAVGWMLREVGKRDQGAEETFLKKHFKKMPRTMLRYAIERFDSHLKKLYMAK